MSKFLYGNDGKMVIITTLEEYENEKRIKQLESNAVWLDKLMVLKEGGIKHIAQLVCKEVTGSPDLVGYGGKRMSDLLQERVREFILDV